MARSNARFGVAAHRRLPPPRTRKAGVTRRIEALIRLSPLVPLLILAYPILEIVVFILVGQAIGVLWTVVLILAGVVVGAAMVRASGFALLTRLRADMAAGRTPERAMVASAMTAIAGVLFILPGFISDAVGLLLLLPPLQKALAARMSGGVTIVRGGVRARPDVVDLDPADYERGADPASPWRGAKEPPSIGKG